MRRTLGESKEALEFMIKIDQLTLEQRNHMRIIIEALVDCCLEDETRAVVVVGKDSDPYALVMSVNSTDLETSVLLSKVDQAFMLKHMRDQPPKEQLN